MTASPPRHRSSAAGCLAVLVLLAGCGSSGSAAQAKSGDDASTGGQAADHAQVDPCSLLTQAEVSAALGKPYGPGKVASDNPSACSWDATNVLPIESVYVKVDPGSTFNGNLVNSNDAQTKAMLVITAIKGIGDAAYTQSFRGDTHGASVGDELVVKKSDVRLTFTVNCDAMTKAQGFAAAETLAKQAVGRL